MERWKTSLIVVVAALSASLGARPGPWAQTQAAAPQTPTSSNAAPGSVRFAYGGNVAEVPAEFIGGLVLLPLHLNQSQPCLFVLDSTAAATSIDPKRATELGIPAGQSVELIRRCQTDAARTAARLEAEFRCAIWPRVRRDAGPRFLRELRRRNRLRAENGPLVRPGRLPVLGARARVFISRLRAIRRWCARSPTRTAKRSRAISASIRLSMPRCCSQRTTRTPTACCRTSR